MSDSEKASLLRNEAMTPLTGFFNLGPMEMIILLVVGVMIFGRRLPEVGRYLGKGIVAAENGQGLNPLLQYWTMVIHPPMLYLGYVGFTVPFAFAIVGSLIWIYGLGVWGFLAGAVGNVIDRVAIGAVIDLLRRAGLEPVDAFRSAMALLDEAPRI